LEGRSYTI